MPAIDQCEPQVIRALEKAGWVVTHHPTAIRIDERKGNYVFADLRLRDSQSDKVIIVVEVKCFAETQPLLSEFYVAVGQYILYRNALAMNDLDLPLYLAIPLAPFNTFFQHPLIQSVLQDARIKLIVVDLELEEVVTWLD